MNYQSYLLNLNRACHNFKGVVYSTQAIFQILQKFEITPAELLRPFFYLSQRVRLRLATKEKQIDDFHIILLDKDEYQASSKITLDRHTREIIKENAPGNELPEVTSRWNNRGAIDIMLEGHRTPWFHGSGQPIADYSTHTYNLNFLDQPHVIVYVVSGQEPELFKELQSLKIENDRWVKTVFNNNPSDFEQVKKIIVVLNDVQEQNKFLAEDKLRREFPGHIYKILNFNQQNPIQSNIWQKYQRKRINIPGVQSKWPTLLDDANIKNFKAQFEEVLQYQVITQLERNINIMTQKSIEAAKKPVDAFFSFWKRDQKTDAEYQMTQREYFQRYLGDMHFLLGEYETAFIYYKEMVSELKNNKTNTTIVQKNASEYQQYARLLSDSGLQMKLVKKDRDELFQGLDDVITLYVAEKLTPQVLRTIYFYYYAIYIYQRFTKESNFTIRRVYSLLTQLKEPQRPDNFYMYQSLLYEQMAFICLRIEPPTFRKFAQCITVVATQMDQEGFKKNSLRCYRIAEAVYRDCGWSFILNWLWSKLGQNYIEVEMYPEAIDCFKKAFNQINDRQSLDHHIQLVQDWKKNLKFLETNKQSKDQFDLFLQQNQTELKIPSIKGPIDIISEEDRIYVFDSKVNQDIQSILFQTKEKTTLKKTKDIWSNQLPQDALYQEKCLYQSMDVTYLEERINAYNKSPCILNMKKTSDIQDKFNKFGRIAYVDEYITLRIAFQNVLKVPSNITNLKVLYEFYTEEQQINNNQENSDLLQLDVIDSSHSLSPKKVPIQLIQTQLPPHEGVSFTFSRPSTEYVEASLKVNKPGFLQINGISYDYLDIPSTYKITYDLKNQQKTKSVNFFNRFKILPKTAQLQVSVLGAVDPDIYFGEIRPIKLVIKNIGQTAITKASVSPLLSFHFGFQTQDLGPIAPNEEIYREVYLRCSFPENFTAKLLFKYQTLEGIPRCARLQFPMIFKNSFKINIQHEQSAESWKFTLYVLEYFRGMGKSTLEFNQILCINEHWKQHDLAPGQPSYILQSDQEQFLFATFSLQKKKPQKYITQGEFQERAQQFIIDNSVISYVDLGNPLIQTLPQEIVYSFVNEDVKYYFNTYFPFDPTDKTYELPLFLVIQWSFQNPVTLKWITGIHELPFVPNQYLISKKKVQSQVLNELPLTLEFHVQSEYIHDFDDQPLLLFFYFFKSFFDVPVKLVVKNSKFHFPIKFKLEFLNGDEALRFKKYQFSFNFFLKKRSISDTSDPIFTWTGISSLKLQLDPYDQQEIFQSVLVFKDGIYDISRVRVTIYWDMNIVNPKIAEIKDYFSSDFEQVFIKVN